MAPNTYARPLSDAEWEKWKPAFTHLYIGEGRPLPKVMELMESRHGFKASQKMYKNRIKAWGLSKYLKATDAERLAEGGSSDEMTQRAQRSVMRRRTREQTRARAGTHSRHLSNADEDSPPPSIQQQSFPTRPGLTITPTTSQTPLHTHSNLNTQPTPIASASFVTEPSPIQIENHPPWSPPKHHSFQRHGSVTGVIEQFLVNLRAWTHEAFVSRHWERSASLQHTKGRHASRLLASDLQAGIRLLEQNNSQAAWIHWRSAAAHFENPDLFKTWYHETPVRLLFEVSRVTHSGYPDFAAKLLQYISNWAEMYLDKTDSRHALYKLYGEIPVTQLRDLHSRAAHCMLDGLSSRLDKHDPLLFEVRLNRALDIIWFDPTSDLEQWLPPVSEVDRACGPENAFSVYYLLLQAYQQVARGLYGEADDTVLAARRRINTITTPGTLDDWRLGMAYRRLGRMQYTRERYQDARRSFNTALRYVGSGVKEADSIMVEVFQCQESMAKKLGDQEDAELWGQMLRQHEQRISEKEQEEMRRDGAAMQALSPVAVEGAGGSAMGAKRTPSPRPLSRSTTY